jgi:hypothetical protein
MNYVIRKLFISFPRGLENLPVTSSSRGGTNKDLLATGGFVITVGVIIIFMTVLTSEMNYVT